MQASILCCSWCGDNSCGIQTPYFHVLPDSCRCVSTVIWEYPSRSAKHRVVNFGSSSISCFKTFISISSGLLVWDKSSSSKLPFLNRLNQCFAVPMESTSLPIVPHMLLAAYVALRPRRNSWSRSTRSSLWDIFVFNSRSTFVSTVLLLFERYSHLLYGNC